MKSIKRVWRAQPGPKKKVVELEVGGWLGRWFIKRRWGAFTLPLPFMVLVLYWSTESEPDGDVHPLIRVHEFVHVGQDEQNSFFLVSWVRYLWESVRHLSLATAREEGVKVALLEAYYNNAFELEAYLVEQLTEENGLPSWAK